MTAAEWSSTDFYAVLGVAVDADAAEIARAFRRRARECHPDTHPDDPAATERFMAVVAAHDVLSDQVTRRDYDLYRRFGRSALDLSDLRSSAVRGSVYAPPRPASSPEPHSAQSRGRRWAATAVAAAVVVGAFAIAAMGGDRTSPPRTDSSSTTTGPRNASPAEDAIEFAYSFSDIDCSPGGWSGVFVNGESVPFDGVLSAVAVVDDTVVAHSDVDATVPAGGQQLIQFNWQGVPPVDAECRIEHVQPR